jgi:hypothetical protein
MLFRNDALLEGVKQLYRGASRNPDSLTTTVFEFAGEASLSWRLDEDERGLLIDQARSPGIGEKLEAVGRWLSS